MFFTALILPRIKLIISCCFPLTGTSFKRVIPDSGPASNNPEKVRKLLLCTGKVYYELAKVRVLEHEHNLLLPPLLLFMIFSILAFFPATLFVCLFLLLFCLLYFFLFPLFSPVYHPLSHFSADSPLFPHPSSTLSSLHVLVLQFFFHTSCSVSNLFLNLSSSNTT